MPTLPSTSPKTGKIPANCTVIPLRDGSKAALEWALVELQGLLTREGDPTCRNIGSLHMVNNKPVLLVGSSRLDGEVKSCNPLLVMSKAPGAWAVQGVVTKKIVFKSRPRALVRSKAK